MLIKKLIYDDFKRENLIDKSVENNHTDPPKKPSSHNAHPCCESSRHAFHKNRKTGKFNRKSPLNFLMHCASRLIALLT